MTDRLIASTILLAFACAALPAQLPNPGTHDFACDFNGTQSVTFNSATAVPIACGFVGMRDPNGDHGGSPGWSMLAGGLLSYQGGQGNFSDTLIIDAPLTGMSSQHVMVTRFRRDGSQSTTRNSFQMLLGDILVGVDGGSGNATVLQQSGGGPTISTPLPISTGVWYFLEIERTATAAELRIWEDTLPRPSTPDLTLAAAPVAPTSVVFQGPNYISPAVSVDWIFIDGLSPAWPGTGEDLVLATGLNGAPLTSAAPDDVKAVIAGDLLTIQLTSPSGTFNGIPIIVAGQFFDPATPPLGVAGFPSIHFDPLATFVIHGLGSPLGAPVLPSAGFTTAHVVPVGLVGTHLLIQGLAIDPVANNGFFAVTDGHQLTP